MTTARYTLDDEPVVLSEFLAVNLEELTEDEIARAHALQPGESMLLGGGAGAEFTLAREA